MTVTEIEDRIRAWEALEIEMMTDPRLRTAEVVEGIEWLNISEQEWGRA